MKVCGALFVIFSGTAIGWICGINLRKRVSHLGKFIQFFQWLETEVNYQTLPLREACEKIRERIQDEMSTVVKVFTDALNSTHGLTADEAWQELIRAGQEHLSLKEQDWAVLSDFGRTLGTTDCRHQVKAITQVREGLKIQYSEAKEYAEKNERIYRYLGVAVGAMIVFFIY